MGNFTEVATADGDGRRKWVYPLPTEGKWKRRRLAVAIGLILFLIITPWTKFNGKQTIRIDIPNSQFDFFGFSFWANENVVLLGFLFLVLSVILILTAVYGRAFCGWACPMTVFMEFVYRPIERLFEGSGVKQRRLHDQAFSKRWTRTVPKWIIFAVISWVISNTVVAYFVGSDQLIQYIFENPLKHWAAFVGMLVFWGIVLFQFGWFREQICSFVCPYGRLQSLLLDKDSLIVAYDEKRGEPRGKLGKTTGDCIDCHMCQKVCPTGIDIREGLQMECIQCTLCIDACDEIMTKVNKPLGLIRYDTQNNMESNKKRILRPRLAIYGAISTLALFLLLGFGASRNELSASVHREFSNKLFTLDSNDIVYNTLRFQLRNRSDENRKLIVTVDSPPNLEIVIPQGQVVLKSQEKKTVHFLAKLPLSAFNSEGGSVNAKIQVQLEGEEPITLETKLFGPVNAEK